MNITFQWRGFYLSEWAWSDLVLKRMKLKLPITKRTRLITKDSQMAIKKIYCDLMTYEVGEEDVLSIELTNHGNETTTIYKVERKNDEPLYVGMLEHEVEHKEGQMTIFDCL